MSTRERLVALQSTQELARKAVKARRRGYGKEGSYYRGTVESSDLKWRLLLWFSLRTPHFQTYRTAE